MVLDIVAIVTPAPGKEARVEEILKDLTAKVEQHEPDVAKYMAYKSQNAEGATEYVFVERYVMLPHTSTISNHQYRLLLIKLLTCFIF
jgi:quinol monooxygenase YgiN